ncbi:hypothetical protein AeMF1_018116 [Aphanomyces euteiches]|nr:hypothetical protein AeMF1_018116 [Aphanomyces euteiches]KAH9191157.1 hypothetical protein AeNC1_006879 [Aphanomyces euteiches]
MRPQSAEELYNYRHSRARIVVERAFGMWKMKWKVLCGGLGVCIRSAIDIIHVCAALHNLAIEFNPSIVSSTLGDDELPRYQDEMNEVQIEEESTAESQCEVWRKSIAYQMWEAYVGNEELIE